MLTGALEGANEGYGIGEDRRRQALRVRLAAARRAVPGRGARRTSTAAHDHFAPANAHLVAAALDQGAPRAGGGRPDGDGVGGRHGAPGVHLRAGDLAAWLVGEVGRLAAWPARLNLGCGTDHSIAEFYETARDVVGYRGGLVYDTSKPSGVPRRLIDSSAARALGWAPPTSLEDGMAARLRRAPSHRPVPHADPTDDRRHTMPTLPRVPAGHDAPGTTPSCARMQGVIAERPLHHGSAGRGVRAAVRRRPSAPARRHGELRQSSANLVAVAAAVLDPRSDLNPGDEVLVPAVSWATTYYPLHQYGLRLQVRGHRPRHAQHGPGAGRGGDRPAHEGDLRGQPARQPERLRPAAARSPSEHGLLLLEDNCESLGATFEGRFAGTFGAMGTLSAFFSHHISTMEGGVVLTDDEQLRQMLVSLRAHGWTRELPSRTSCTRSPATCSTTCSGSSCPAYNVRPLEMSRGAGHRADRQGSRRWSQGAARTPPTSGHRRRPRGGPAAAGGRREQLVRLLARARGRARRSPQRGRRRR